MLRIDLNFGGAGLVADEEYLLEGRAAVGGAVEAAFFVGAVGVAGDCDIDAVGVGWIDRDLADLLAVAKAEMLPGLATIG